MKREDGSTIFPNPEYLPEFIKQHIDIDKDYISAHSGTYDMSWQAIKLGFVGEAKTYKDFKKLPIQDNYRFLRKNFNAAWVSYVLLLRICSLHNPLKEIAAYWKTKNAKRLNKNIDHVVYKEWDGYISQKIIECPLVSVVIPTLNRYDYLKDVLNDFENQDYKNFEIVIVDQSEPYNPDFYRDFQLNINLIRQEEKALWLARNTAIRSSKGSLIALSEDDVRINADWISSHLKCLDFFNADISAGVFYPEDKAIPYERSYFAIASQFATGNAMLYKKIFKEIGLFDRQFEGQRMGDGEFGLRAFLKGFKSISNPIACCIDVKAGTGGLREMGSWDAFRPSKLFAPRPIPSVVYLFRRYHGNKAAILSLLRTVPISLFPYQYKKNKPLLIFAAILTIFLFPLIVIQVIQSWRLSSKKIKEGPKIGEF